MHINFATKHGFDFDLKALKNIKINVETLRQIRFNRLTMVVIAGAVILFMLTFGIAQKLRLDSYMGKVSKQDRINAELKKKGTLEGVAVVKSGGQGKIMQNYENRVRWSNILISISNIIPRQIWLQSIATPKKGIMEVSGDAPDQSAVAKLIGDLEKSGLFSSVEMVSSDMAPAGEMGITKLKFVINSTLK